MKRYTPLFEDILNYQDQFRSIKTLDDGSFTYLEETPGVTVLPWKHSEDGVNMSILLRQEANPLFTSGFSATVITGRQDPGETLIQTCIRELKEEAGYQLDSNLDRILDCGKYRFSKGHLTADNVFIVDISGISEGIATTDGSDFEKNSKNHWVSVDEFFDIANESEDSAIKICAFYLLLLIYKGKNQ